MRIALFGYSHFTRHCMLALQQLGHSVEFFCPIEDEPLLARYGLTGLDLPVHWFEDMADPALLDVLDNVEPELILSIIFNHRLPESVTRKARVAALNVHPAPLPDIRTAAVWYWPLRLGLTQSEVCIHHLTPMMDQGPVVLRFPFRLHEFETQGTLTRRLVDLAPKIMKQLHSLLTTGPIPEGEQQSEGTTYPSRREVDLWIDFNQPAEPIRNHVRACTPYHPAQARFRGQTIAVHEVGSVSRQLPFNYSPGELAVDNGLWLTCGDVLLPVTVLAVPGEGVFSGERFAELFDVESGESLSATE